LKIRNHELRPIGFHQAKRFMAGFGGSDTIPFHRERLGENLANVWFIIDDENVFRGGINLRIIGGRLFIEIDP